MRKKFTNAFVVIAFMLTTLVALVSPIAAQPAPPAATSTTGDNLICRIFPFIGQIEFTSSLCGNGKSAGETIGPWISFILSLIFIGIILLAVVSIIRAAITYIRSEGDEGKVQEAQKAIKSVFIGIGALIVGLVGLAIVITVIGASNALNTDETPGAVDEFLNEL